MIHGRFWGGAGANDAPGGAAGGDLGGTYPNPSVAKINGVTLGSTAATAGNILAGSGTQWVSVPVSGDAALSSAGALTVSSIGGKAVTLGGALTLSGAFAATLTLTGTTTITLPTSGTLAILGANTFTGVQTFAGSSSIDGSGHITAGAQFLVNGTNTTVDTNIKAGGNFTVALDAGGLYLGASNDTPLLRGSAGVFKYPANSITANGSVATAMSSLGPAGSHTTIQEWFTIQNSSGVVRYIPAF